MDEPNRNLWEPIDQIKVWSDLDTSIIDEIADSWFQRREKLRKNSEEYTKFLNQLKREHAVETGVVERLYDLDRGVTETFIKKGFHDAYISHGQSNIPTSKLQDHLKDHLDSVNFIFDVVKENRPLSVGFIKELHQLVTRHQEYTEGKNQFGEMTQMKLKKGVFKSQPNNPVRPDGNQIRYCPPEQVDSEMDNLIAFYSKAEKENIHPLIIASWLHHAFTIIHPFQDGNGRIARLITSLVLIKHGFFPFTVLREEAKAEYISALEEADNGRPQKLVSYIAHVQKRYIQKALNLKDVSSESFEEASKVFAEKLENWQEKQSDEQQRIRSNAREKVFQICLNFLEETKSKLRQSINGESEISIFWCRPDGQEQHFYHKQIVEYAKKHNYYFNYSMPRAWLTFRIKLSEQKKYQLGVSLHHYGYEDSTLAIGSFLEYLEDDANENRIESAEPMEIEPHVISIYDEMNIKEKNIERYLESVLTTMLAQIASDL